MKLPMASIRRILTALLAITLTAATAAVGWAAWQDHAYAKALAHAANRVASPNAREIAAAAEAEPSYYCERRAGMPTAEALIRMLHATDAAQHAGARRSASSYRRVRAPSRWSDFNDLVTIRRELDVDLTQLLISANDRAVVVAAAARPRTNLRVIEAVIHDRKYRLLAARADGTVDAISSVNANLRRALPSHYLHARAIEHELGRTVRKPTLSLGDMYMSFTMPRSGPSAATDPPADVAAPPPPLLPGDPTPPRC